MFDKTKERVKKFQEDHESVHKIIQHVEKNKNTYLTGAGCLGAGFVFGKYYQRPIIIDFQPVINNAPVFNNHNIGNVVENTVNNIGHLHKIVKRIKPDGTVQFFESVNDAARELAPEYGIKASSTLDRISKVANGHIPDYRDDKFIFVGVGTR
jgi:hypothetical protein